MYLHNPESSFSSFHILPFTLTKVVEIKETKSIYNKPWDFTKHGVNLDSKSIKRVAFFNIKNLVFAECKFKKKLLIFLLNKLVV